MKRIRPEQIETHKIEENAPTADLDRQMASVTQRPRWLQRDLLVLGELMALLAWNA